MAYLRGFKYDIFISYNHVDNLGDDAWVSGFHKTLEVALAQRIGRMGLVGLWRDKRLQGDQLFDETIREAVTGSALFLAITSNGYLKSDYCRQELRWFHEKAQAEPHGLKVGDRSRIYNVLLTRLPPERWPGEYPRLSGFPFHDADDPADDRDLVGAPTDPALDRARHRRQMNKLADALHQMLEDFSAALQLREAPASVPGPKRAAAPADAPRVFVADVADTLAASRRRLINELQRKGIVVESGVPPPYAPEAHDARVREAARDALLSVHLLDEWPGREVEGAPGQTYPLRQLELVRGTAKAQLIWVQSELDAAAVEDEVYRAELRRIEHGERGDGAYEFVRGSSTLLVPQIVDKLEQARKASQSPAPSLGAVLLDTHLKDQLYAFELGRLLVERSVQPYINPQEDDPNKNLEAFEARLRQVSTLVILYGQVNEGWVRHRLGVALQLSVVNNLPIKSFYVLVVPPARLVKGTRFQLGPMAAELIDNSGSERLDGNALASLWKGLG